MFLYNHLTMRHLDRKIIDTLSLDEILSNRNEYTVISKLLKYGNFTINDYKVLMSFLEPQDTDLNYKSIGPSKAIINGTEVGFTIKPGKYGQLLTGWRGEKKFTIRLEVFTTVFDVDMRINPHKALPIIYRQFDRINKLANNVKVSISSFSMIDMTQDDDIGHVHTLLAYHNAKDINFTEVDMEVEIDPSQFELNLELNKVNVIIKEDIIVYGDSIEDVVGLLKYGQYSEGTGIKTITEFVSDLKSKGATALTLSSIFGLSEESGNDILENGLTLQNFPDYSRIVYLLSNKHYMNYYLKKYKNTLST